ncbi:MAG TPA: DUF5060 domain-containing protein [Bryobacteraceae bacterium]|nr:DUF5060 domain-containing protein [Bryobacteraceae bacterium]
MYRFIAGALCAARLLAQSGCASPVAWSPCDLSFDLQANESAATAHLEIEFRSPHQKTYKIPAFHDNGRQLTVRVTPTEPGTWTYRVSSSLARLDGKESSIVAAESDSPGFVHVANLHHFQTEANLKQHLWMATALDHFATIPRTQFDQRIEELKKEKFTHVRVTIEANADLREAADRVRAITARGLVADLALASIPAEREARQAYITDMVARFGAMNITWMGVPSFENVAHGKSVLKDAGALLKTLDTYDHPRTTLASVTSAPLIGDDWMTLIDYGTPDPNVGAVEHQLYQMPGINSGIKNASDLWNATMNGQYPASGEGPYMTAWFDFMAGNRYWELEPYFNLDGGRAVALEGVEYVVYIEKPGPVEVEVEKHGYDVAWMNPLTGELIKEKKGYNGEHFTGEPPDSSHPWVLHISRERTKEGMLKSWKFESRPVPVQVIERDESKIPFDVASPGDVAVSVSKPPYYALKINRETRATRTLLIEWTGEVPTDGEGYRVIGTGREGTMRIPASLADHYPAVVDVRVALLNAYGKAYVVDKVYRLVE